MTPATQRGMMSSMAKTSTFTKKHFDLVASALLTEKPKHDYNDPYWRGAMDQWRAQVICFAKKFEAINPNFDRPKFLTACGWDGGGAEDR